MIVAGRGGRIINIASILGAVASSPCRPQPTTRPKVRWSI